MYSRVSIRGGIAVGICILTGDSDTAVAGATTQCSCTAGYRTDCKSGHAKG